MTSPYFQLYLHVYINHGCCRHSSSFHISLSFYVQWTFWLSCSYLSYEDHHQEYSWNPIFDSLSWLWLLKLYIYLKIWDLCLTQPQKLICRMKIVQVHIMKPNDSFPSDVGNLAPGRKPGAWIKNHISGVEHMIGIDLTLMPCIDIRLKPNWSTSSKRNL